MTAFMAFLIKKGDARECKIYIFFLSVSTFFHFLFGEGQKAHVGPEEDIKASVDFGATGKSLAAGMNKNSLNSHFPRRSRNSCHNENRI